MRDSVVLFVDVLGSKDSASDHTAQKRLEQLHLALASAMVFIKDDDWPPTGELYSVKTFTDNLVLAYPISHNHSDAEGTIGHVFQLASFYQYDLATRGVFLRGGITRGLIYVDDDMRARRYRTTEEKSMN